MKYLILVISVLFSLSACKKSLPPHNDSNSICLPTDNMGIEQTFFVDDGPQYMRPTFNPNNSSEIVFFFRNWQNGALSLMKYNMQTKEKKVLVEDVNVMSKPSWSTNGWIAFDNAFNYNVWAVKSDGDSLTQISDNTYSVIPVWHPDGKHLYYQYSENLGYPYVMIKQKTGAMKQVDTVIHGDNRHLSVSSSGNVIAGKFHYGANENIYYSNMDLPYLELTAPAELANSQIVQMRSLACSPSGNSLYLCCTGPLEYSGLYHINIQTSAVTRLKEHCWRDFIVSVDHSPDSPHLILGREKSRQEYNEDGTTTNRILKQAQIYLLNLQTGEEQLIEIE